MSKITKLIKYILCLCLVLITFVSVIDVFCFDKKFYAKEYNALNTAQMIGVSQNDLDLMTDDLLDYLKGQKENLDLVVNVKGKDQQAFNERETIHMVDVKDLYDKVILLRNVSIIFLLASLVYLLIKKDINQIDKYYLKVLMVFGFLFAFVGLMCLIDFDSFWVSFHEVIFTKNDYWLLDPRTDLLINMVPSKFFFDLVTRIVSTIILCIIAIYFGLKVINKRLFNND